MRQLLMIAFAVLLVTTVSACSPDDSPDAPEIPETEQPDNNNGEEEGEESMKLTIKVGSSTFTATLTDNETAKAFRTMLPMTINMSELNRNEKYYYLPTNLPTASSNFGTINNGDLMLYGSNCLVLFYKTFSTSYSYTRIGTLDNASGLESTLGIGSVTVVFEMSNE